MDETPRDDASDPGATGDPRVDDILTGLDELDETPVMEHAGLYLEVHARLTGELNPGAALRGAGAHGPA